MSQHAIWWGWVWRSLAGFSLGILMLILFWAAAMWWETPLVMPQSGEESSWPPSVRLAVGMLLLLFVAEAVWIMQALLLSRLLPEFSRWRWIWVNSLAGIVWATVQGTIVFSTPFVRKVYVGWSAVLTDPTTVVTPILGLLMSVAIWWFALRHQARGMGAWIIWHLLAYLIFVASWYVSWVLPPPGGEHLRDDTPFWTTGGLLLGIMVSGIGAAQIRPRQPVTGHLAETFA